MSTETFSFTVTYSNNIYRVFQSSNGNTLCTFPTAQMIMKTHPSSGNLYYLGTSGNLITLDYTLCTNLTTASRQAQLDAIVALATGAPMGAVTISGQPISTTLNMNLGETYSRSATVSATNSIAIVLRPGVNQTNTRILGITASSSAAASATSRIILGKNVTINGGTWAPDGQNLGSQMEVNTGGALGTQTNACTFYFNSSLNAQLENWNITYAPQEILTVGVLFSGIGNISVSIMWTETP